MDTFNQKDGNLPKSMCFLAVNTAKFGGLLNLDYLGTHTMHKTSNYQVYYM